MKTKLQKEKHSQQSMEIHNSIKENTTSKTIYIKRTHAQHLIRNLGPTLWLGLCLTHIFDKNIRRLEISLTRVPLLQGSIITLASPTLSKLCLLNIQTSKGNLQQIDLNIQDEI